MDTRVETYKKEREELMQRWNAESREWVEAVNGMPIDANFFKDGIIDPEVWFKNEFKPLFILKEVNDNEPERNECIDFVAMVDGGKDQDIWNAGGKGTWMALGTLARGILEAHKNNGTFSSYNETRKKLNTKDREEYHKTLKNIAIINIKKLSGGNNARADESRKTKYFECHARKFKDNLQKQIKQIEPTVIIFCGSNMDSCFDFEDNKLYSIPVVFGLHPNRSRRTDFFDRTIEEVCKVTK